MKTFITFLLFFFSIVSWSQFSPTHYGVGAGTTGGNGSFFGYYAGNNATGINNSFFGHGAGTDNTVGSYNTFLGTHAGRYNISGNRNTFIGGTSGESNSSGSDNVFAGYFAGYSNSTGNANILIGQRSGYSNNADNNVFIGDYAGYNTTSGGSNVFFGSNAGRYNTTGYNNILIGTLAGFSNTGYNNTFMGYSAGYSNSGNYNVFIGSNAGHKNTAGTNNVYLGDSAGTNSTASSNVFVGATSGKTNTTGYQNTFVGFKSGEKNTTGYRNTFIGRAAGLANNTGSNNTFLGFKAGFHNSAGHYNTMVGFHSGLKSKGQYNAFFGNKTGENLLTGDNNTMIGTNAGDSLTSGDSNTFIGANSNIDSLGANYDNSMALGYNAVISASNQIQIGNQNITEINVPVNISTTSDARYKFNVEQDKNSLDFILALNPVTYQLNVKKLNALTSPPNAIFQEAEQLKTAIRYNGFLAQEVEEASQQTSYFFSGVLKPKTDKGRFSLRYSEFVVPLVGALQDQQKIINNQDAKIEQLQSSNQNLNDRLSRLEKMLEHYLTEEVDNNFWVGNAVPNPSQNEVTIEYSLSQKTSKFNNSYILLYNTQGQLVKKESIENTSSGFTVLSISDLPSGTYYYSINSGQYNTKSKTLIKMDN